MAFDLQVWSTVSLVESLGVEGLPPRIKDVPIPKVQIFSAAFGILRESRGAEIASEAANDAVFGLYAYHCSGEVCLSRRVLKTPAASSILC